MNQYLYWEKKDLSNISLVKDFPDVSEVSISVIKKIPDPPIGISFPLTSGGYGFQNNVKIIERVILKLTSVGFNVFNILPLERGIKPLKENWGKSNSGYCYPILNVVYKNIFESRLLKMFFISPDWLSSEGSSWEYEKLFHLGIPVIEFPMGWYLEILEQLELVNLQKAAA